MCRRLAVRLTLVLGHPPESYVSSGLHHYVVSENLYLSLEIADQQTIEDFAGLITVADVLERLGCVLTADVEQDLFTTSVVTTQSAEGSSRRAAAGVGPAQ